MSDFSETVRTQKGRASKVGQGKFGAQLVVFANGEKGLLKSRPFETNSFRGIRRQEMPEREVAAFVLDSQILDFGIVPETVLTKWKGRDASIQHWKPGGLIPRELVPGIFDKQLDDWKLRLAKFFNKVNLDALRKVVLFDLIVNNVDRHGKNILVDPPLKTVWAIDNGLTFGRYYRKYRNVFHKYLYYSRLPIPSEMIKKLSRIERPDFDVLLEYLPRIEVDDTWWRLQFVIDHSDRLAFKRMGKTSLMSGGEFPTYEEWFKKKQRADLQGLAHVYSPQAEVDVSPAN